MAGYDNSMDAVLATIGTTGEDAGNIRVTIQSYNGGTRRWAWCVSAPRRMAARPSGVWGG